MRPLTRRIDSAEPAPLSPFLHLTPNRTPLRKLYANQLDSSPIPSHKYIQQPLSKQRFEAAGAIIQGVDDANKRIKEILQRQKNIRFQRQRFQEVKPQNVSIEMGPPPSKIELPIRDNLEQTINYDQQYRRLESMRRAVQEKKKLIKKQEESNKSFKKTPLYLPQKRQKEFQTFKENVQERPKEVVQKNRNFSLVSKADKIIERDRLRKQQINRQRDSEKANSIIMSQTPRQGGYLQKTLNFKLNPLIQLLLQQADLDKVLRQRKRLFDFKRRQAQLQRYLYKQGLNYLSLQPFRPKLQQNDPLSTFYDDVNPSNLVDSFLKAQKHWQSKLKNKFSREEVSQIFQKLKGAKGQKLSIQALVTSMNLQLGTFFRNRDLIIIFRRISKEEGLKETDWVREFGA